MNANIKLQKCDVLYTGFDFIHKLDIDEPESGTSRITGSNRYQMAYHISKEADLRIPTRLALYIRAGDIGVSLLLSPSIVYIIKDRDSIDIFSLSSCLPRLLLLLVFVFVCLSTLPYFCLAL